VKNLTKRTVAAVLTLWLSHFAFGQAPYKTVKVLALSPNSYVALNDSSQVLVNTGTASSNQVSVWSRIGGAQSVSLIGTGGTGAAINNSGDVVGASGPNSSNNLEAFLWRPASGSQYLGTLGSGFSMANGMNNADAVVGQSYTSGLVQHAFLWTQAGGMQDLTPSLTGFGAAATGINASGQVVGYYYPDGAQNTLGFLWTAAAGLQSLGAPGTLAYGINDAGTVVGQSAFANGAKHAFSWTSAGGITDLGTLGGASSSALGINNHGWIVGSSLTTAGALHGFLWTPAGGMRDFGSLAGMNGQPYSLQINNYGIIAVTVKQGGFLLIPKIMGTFSSSANPSKVGQPVTFTATLTSFVGPPPDGETVRFAFKGKVLGTATLTGGVAQFTTSALTAGTGTVSFTYLGDANYLLTKWNAFAQVVNP